MTAVLVTGASYGIGAEVARQYAARGARVALVARRAHLLEARAKECRDAGASDVLVLPGDVTDRDAVARAAARIDEAWGRLDRAFLNAGGYGVNDRAEMARARKLDWTTNGFSAAAAEDVMRVNYVGVLNWLEPVLATMRRQRAGVIAFTGAMAADRGYPSHGPYAASKAALRALADALRADAARFGVRVCLLEPGCVTSGLTENECCESMPFKQPTVPAVRAFIDGVERGRAVVRYPWHGSLVSLLAAAVPRPLFDLWARRQLPRV